MCQNYISVSGCKFGDQCQFRHTEADGRPSKKSKKGDKGSVAFADYMTKLDVLRIDFVVILASMVPALVAFGPVEKLANTKMVIHAPALTENKVTAFVVNRHGTGSTSRTQGSTDGSTRDSAGLETKKQTTCPIWITKASIRRRSS